MHFRATFSLVLRCIRSIGAPAPPPLNPLKFSAHLTSVDALPGETEQVQQEIKKKNITKLIHYRYVTSLITVHLTVFAVTRMQQQVYGTLFRNINELKKQNIINTVINEWIMHFPACVCTNGRYFEYLLSAVAQLKNSINSRAKC